MADDRKVHPLPNRERDDSRAATDKAKRLLSSDQVRDEALIAAKLRKIHYDALREAGFNEYQALVIIAKMY